MPADEVDKWNALVDEVNTVAAELDAIRPGLSGEIINAAVDVASVGADTTVRQPSG